MTRTAWAGNLPILQATCRPPETQSNLFPLARDRDLELAVFVGFDRGRGVVAQIIQVITELEPGIHYLFPGDFLAGMAGSTAH